MDTRELFERYGDAVFRLAWSCTGSRQDAEDVTQTVFLKVLELKAGEREILYLIYYEGFSTRETASLLGISQTAVTTRLQRARKKLRERLEEEGRP